MSKFTLALAIVVALEILTLAPAARAPLLELDGCHDDLDRLRGTASDASDASEDAESKRGEFEDCRRDPFLARSRFRLSGNQPSFCFHQASA